MLLIPCWRRLAAVPVATAMRTGFVALAATFSTWGEAGATMKLDIDPTSHPAWTGVHRLIDSGGQLAKFNKRFEGFGLKSS